MNDAPGASPDRSLPGAAAVRRRPELRADCARCSALCCAAPAFSASAQFAIDKPAGQPCPNLRGDFRCSIHDQLRPAGFGGCAAFDCLGAGQQVTQVTFSGRNWRQEPELAAPMFAAFAVMRQLHELLWYLTEALLLAPDDPLPRELDEQYEKTQRLTHCQPQELVTLDVAAHRQDVNAVLLRTSEHVRGRARPRAAGHRLPLRASKDLSGADLRGVDLVGADLRSADLSGASLRGALVIGADLTDAGLAFTDLTGADLRGARLAGADLAAAIFLTQSQVDSATGDRHTRLPPSLRRPHWARADLAD